MKNHLYRLNLCIHTISIHVSFPCTVGASLQIDNQEWDITDNIDIKQAQVSINAPIQKEVSLLFNPRTSVYSIKKAVINFFLRTKSGKLQAGSTTIFLNKSITGCTKQIALISKCSDRQATLQYSMHLQLLQQTESNLSASMLKGSQVSDGNTSFRNSSVSCRKRLFQQTTNLFQSIVHEVDQQTDQPWQTDLNISKVNSGNNSFISEIKQTQSSKNIAPGWRNQTDSLFRKSRIEGSIQEHRKSSVYQKSTPFEKTMSASKARYLRDEEDTKLVLQNKVYELQKQNKDLKQTLNLIKQKFEQQIMQEKNSLRKSQISQTTLKEELQLMRQKFGSLEKETKKMMFEKNEILNNYNNRQVQSISQVKAKEKAMTLENNRLLLKIEKLQKQLTQQQEKYKSMQSRFKEQQSVWNKKQKQYEYYQHEAMQLDEKLSELRIVEEELHHQIQELKEEMMKKESAYQKELQKYKKDLTSTKEIKDQQSKGLGKQLTELRISLKQKEAQINTMKKDFETEKRQLSKQESMLKQQKEKLQKQLTQQKDQTTNSQKNAQKLQETISMLQERISTMDMQMHNIVQNRDQVLGELESKLQQLNIQQFKLNEYNFQLEERIAILEKQLKEKQMKYRLLSQELRKVKQSLAQKEIQVGRLTLESQTALSVKSSTEGEVREMRKQMNKKQQALVALQRKLEQIQMQLTASHGHNHDLEVNSYLKIQQKDEEIHVLNDKIQELQTTITQQSDSINQVDSQLECAKASIYKLQTEKEELKNTQETLQGQLEERQRSLKSVNQKMRKAQVQLKEAKSEILIHIKRTEESHSIQASTQECINVFEELFLSIIAKDYTSIITASKSPSSYKYSANNRNVSPNLAKKNSPQATELRRLNSYSKRDISFAENLTKRLEELEQLLTKTFQKQQEDKEQINRVIQQLENSQRQLSSNHQEINQLNNQVDSLTAQCAKLNEQLALNTKNSQKSTKETSSLNSKLKDFQSRAEKQKTIIEQLREDINLKAKEIFTLKNTINKSQKTLKDTESSYQQSKQKMQIENNQLKAQMVEVDRQLVNERQMGKRKQTKIVELQSVVENLKNQNLKGLNQVKKQNLEAKRQLTQIKKQIQRKTIQITRSTNIQSDLNKKIETISAQSKENLQKFQRSNQQLALKNKQIGELQVTIRQRSGQLSKVKARTIQLQQEVTRIKKQKQELSKGLVTQQQQNGKNLLTVKEQRQLLLKKEETLKETQKELKLMEGQIFNLKRVKTPQHSTVVNQESSTSSSSYVYKKTQPEKQSGFHSPRISAYSYRKSNSVYNNTAGNINQPQSDQLLKDEVKNLKDLILQKQKNIIQLQQKLKNKIQSTKQNPFSKITNSSTLQSSDKKGQEMMKQRILQNLQSIQNIITSPDSGYRFDKYKVELVSLISKNRKIILGASPFDQMRKIYMLIQKTKTSIQNKLKLQTEVKTFIVEELMKIQVIVDEVMGK